MFFRKWVFDSKKKRIAFNNVELHKLVIKSLLRENNILFKDRIYFSLILNKYSKFTSISYFRHFCIISGYPKSVFRFFKLSRHVCKSFASFGYLNGLRKSS